MFAGYGSVDDMFDVDESVLVLYMPGQKDVYSYSEDVAESLVLKANSWDKIAKFASVGLRVGGSYHVVDIYCYLQQHAILLSYATCEMEQLGGAVLVWISHQQMALHSISSLPEP